MQELPSGLQAELTMPALPSKPREEASARPHSWPQVEGPFGPGPGVLLPGVWSALGVADTARAPRWFRPVPWQKPGVTEARCAQASWVLVPPQPWCPAARLGAEIGSQQGCGPLGVLDPARTCWQATWPAKNL